MKIKRFALVLTLLMLLQSTTALASNSVQFRDSLSYTVYNEDGSIAEEGIIPDKELRISWSGVTLKNNQTVSFRPTDGLYCRKGIDMEIRVDLDRTATVEYQLWKDVNFKENVVIYPYFMSKIEKGTNLKTIYKTVISGYYMGKVTNLSSDPVIIKNFSITF